jgi:uncharacterized membrane protein YhaH (DUF805 family)
MSKYADFRGRAKRSEFWWFFLFQYLASMGLAIVGIMLGLSEDGINGLSGLLGLALTLPYLAVTARRLHDVSRSGWWMLIPMTIVGIIPYIYWMCKAGDAQENQYGAMA